MWRWGRVALGEAVSTSPLESDEWVIAMREAEVGEVLAFNSADFSSEPFASTVTPDHADAFYEYHLSRWVGDEDRKDGIRETDAMTSLDRCDATGAPIARFDPAPADRRRCHPAACVARGMRQGLRATSAW